MVNDWQGMHHRNRDKELFSAMYKGRPGERERETEGKSKIEGIIRVRPLHPQCNYRSAASGPSAGGS